jgi:hypothetical protein
MQKMVASHRNLQVAEKTQQIYWKELQCDHARLILKEKNVDGGREVGSTEDLVETES